jgi:hypothetical protein
MRLLDELLDGLAFHGVILYSRYPLDRYLSSFIHSRTLCLRSTHAAV